jgi:hypothetical protein
MHYACRSCVTAFALEYIRQGPSYTHAAYCPSCGSERGPEPVSLQSAVQLGTKKPNRRQGR